MILLINGQVGGVGKSTLARLILEYFVFLKLNNYRFFDLDTTKSDVGIAYDPASYQQAPEENSKGKKNKGLGQEQDSPQEDSIASRLIRFTDNRRDLAKVDILFEEGMSKNVVANLPANIMESLDAWISENGLLDLAQKLEMQFINAFVVSKQPNCVDLFCQTVNKYGNDRGMKHILVYNEKADGVPYAEFKANNNKLTDLLKTYQDNKCPIVEMSMPVLNEMYYDMVLNKNLTFSNAIKHESGLGLIPRQAIANFVRTSNNSLQQMFASLGTDLHNPQAKKNVAEISLEVVNA